VRARRTITVVGCHAGGEIGNVIVGGVLPPRGATVFEQMQTLAREDDWLRKLLLREPRGSVACHANLVVPATRDDCAAGFIIMEPTEYPAMSGSNTICTATVLLETGMIPMREPETVLRLEAPGGVVEVRASCRAGRCESVELTNVPSFADRLDAPLEVEGLGTLTVDVAYGGMWYAIADAQALGFALEPYEARDLSLAGERIRAAAREQLPCTHPENPEIAGVSIVQLAHPWRGIGQVTRNAVIVAPGRLDRSATGTGLSARMAVLHARGLMQPGDAMTHASVLGSTFDGRIVDETRAGDRAAIVPAIRGSAWITGVSQLLVEPTDPFPEGYLLPDTWGVSGLDAQY
jgi:proline racemase